MKYFITPFICLIYFELLGRFLFYRFKQKHFEFSFVLGFISVMGYLYLTTSLISAFHLSFYLLLAVFLIGFILSIYFIIKNIKQLNLNFNYKKWILLLIFALISLYISYNRTLGETHGFDTLFYLNIVSNNIGNNSLNSIHPHFGGVDYNYIGADYTFQSFYNFSSLFIYLFRSIYGFFKVSFETMPAFIWTNQIILTFSFSASSIIALDELKINNKILKISLLFIFNLFMANLYYNNVYGFIGNNHRMYILVISSIFIYRYFYNKDDMNIYLFYLTLSGLSGVSSTGAFTTIFYLFGLFFVLVDHRNKLIKEYVFVSFIPLLNIVFTKFKTRFDLLIGYVIIFGILYFLNDYIIKIFKNKKIRIITIILSSLIFIVGSFYITKDLFNIKMFFENYSEIADMSFDYFMFNDIRHYIFNTIVLIPLFYYLVKNRQKPIAITFIILIAVFFNPLGSTFMNKINWVYYRGYDIIINPYTISLFVVVFFNDLKNKMLKIFVSGFLLIGSCVLAFVQIPMHYHPTFKIYDNYNKLFKIDNDELEIIYNVRRMVKDKNIKNPHIITDSFYMYSYIPDSVYLFGKEKRYNYLLENEYHYKLFTSLFPYDYIYDNFKPEEKGDYSEINNDLLKSGYDILTLKYEFVYEENGSYKHLYEKINEKFDNEKDYATSKYAVFDIREYEK